MILCNLYFPTVKALPHLEQLDGDLPLPSGY